MPNIYLRLPTSRCQFFRNRDPKRVLAKDEPLVFSVYSPEYFVMRSSLTNAGALSQEVNTQCFSQQQWRNMLNGRHPLGGNMLVTRDNSEYLTYDEVLHLNGNKEYSKSDNEDYLCIKLPRTSIILFLLARCSSSSMETPSSSYFFRRLRVGYLYRVKGSFGLIGVLSTSVLLTVLPDAFSSEAATEISMLSASLTAAAAAFISFSSCSALAARSARCCSRKEGALASEVVPVCSFPASS